MVLGFEGMVGLRVRLRELAGFGGEWIAVVIVVIVGDS